MGAEDILYRLDPRKIRVESGDISAGYWELHSCVMQKSPELFKETAASDACAELNLDQMIEKLEVKNVKDANPTGNMLGVGVGALAGLRYFGPVGAIGGAVAGHLLVGNRHEMHVDVLLRDGRRFTAYMDKDVFKRMQTIAARPVES